VDQEVTRFWFSQSSFDNVIVPAELLKKDDTEHNQFDLTPEIIAFEGAEFKDLIVE
jgi:hypothetical protein